MVPDIGGMLSLLYMELRPKKVALIVIAAVAIIAAGAWYWMGRAPEAPEAPAEEVTAQIEETPAERLGGDLLEKAQNPLKDELPQTNPFTGAETNPFIDVYENPFAG